METSRQETAEEAEHCVSEEQPQGSESDMPLHPQESREEESFEPMPFTEPRQRRIAREESGFESVQDVIFKSMQETRRLRKDEKEPSIFLDTFKDIQEAAASTVATFKNWSNQEQRDEPPQAGAAHSKAAPSASGVFEPVIQTQESSLISDVTGFLSFCGVNMTSNHPKAIEKVKAVSNAMKEDMNNVASGIWKYSGGESDDKSVASLDTIQEDNNMIRRLGSWGTVNTNGTNGTNDTGYSYETGQTPKEIQLVLEDDDGNAIDPVLYQKAQQTREKRTPRRRRLVKFEYPPVRSLRQCPRPDPEDLPKLFFTEDELDQIEDDRYSTMSTDDIEIVAVASDTEVTKPKFSNYKSPRPKSENHATFCDAVSDEDKEASARQQPEPELKSSRQRDSTPYRRREEKDEDDQYVEKEQPKSPSNNGRLVKGVQIFLRERSTGV